MWWINLLWRRFGNLTVIWHWLNNWRWECQCSCWNLTERSASHLLDWERRWIVQSCWCVRKTSYWMVKSQLYYKYVNMKQRCENPKTDSYKLYWGRGIRCLWNKFSDFYDDMYNSYYEHVQLYWKDNTTLDRINVDWDYCKDNCRWVTPKEQANNRRNNIILEYKWKRQSLEAWAKELWLTYTALYLRLHRWGNFSKICDEQLAKYM